MFRAELVYLHKLVDQLIIKMTIGTSLCQAYLQKKMHFIQKKIKPCIAK